MKNLIIFLFISTFVFAGMREEKFGEKFN